MNSIQFNALHQSLVEEMMTSLTIHIRLRLLIKVHSLVGNGVALFCLKCIVASLFAKDTSSLIITEFTFAQLTSLIFAMFITSVVKISDMYCNYIMTTLYCTVQVAYLLSSILYRMRDPVMGILIMFFGLSSTYLVFFLMGSIGTALLSTATFSIVLNCLKVMSSYIFNNKTINKCFLP